MSIIRRAINITVVTIMLLLVSGMNHYTMCKPSKERTPRIVSTNLNANRSARTVVSGGVVGEQVAQVDSASLSTIDSLAQSTQPSTNLEFAYGEEQEPQIDTATVAKREPFVIFSDSLSLSQVAWRGAVIPGYGQIYNRQYWKLPIVYTALAGGIAMFVHENKTYKPLKARYDELYMADHYMSPELESVQTEMIRSNTRRQLYLGVSLASYIYSLCDAAINYSTNDTSDIKRATTLATVCPGAGQIYNKSYWKVPFVVGGFSMMIYVIDWNNRGYQRFKTAYAARVAYDNDKDAYPDGSPDEFSGRYSASDLQSLRNSYRRNRDLSFVFLAGLYVLQIVDAHVDAHFKDYDISDDLAMDIQPTIGYAYSPTSRSNRPTYGFNVGFKF